MKYQIDIDGLRALAVLSVVFFHLGLLKNGFLGVDVFFVISGYLITSKIYFDKNFSLKDFYKRRIRRILPLAFFISFVALIIGFFVMLPDDLENLAQSVIASNLSLNNILLLITTGDYWSTANEYKPLMHYWSLGVEEQFYIFYPLIFIIFSSNTFKKGSVIILSLVSLLLFFYISNSDFVFFTIFTRFWEISFGGLIAIFFAGKKINPFFKNIFSLFLLIIIFDLSPIDNERINLFLTIIFSLFLVINDTKSLNIWYSNKLFRFIGKISFSIYLWHQLILSFYRYVFTEKFTIGFIIIYLIITFIISIITYYMIENRYRNFKLISNKKIFVHLSLIFLMSTFASSYIVYTRGVVRDVPELGIKGYKNIKKHSEYNDDIFQYNTDFFNDELKKILIIGDSHARDLANILLESDFADMIDFRYINSLDNNSWQLKNNAEVIFFCRENGVKTTEVNFIKENTNIPFYVFGSKNFDQNLGKYYNKSSLNNCNESAKLSDRIIQINKKLSNEWGDNFIDIIEPIKDDNNFVSIFTPECKFISQDSKHLTKFGAKYLSQKLKNKLFTLIFQTNNKIISNE
tara:strand:- start:2766 stop:4490 length:1725 start_codon:yes stop_codon:yes gene_type:complete